jgi:hypothetical protein
LARVSTQIRRGTPGIRISGTVSGFVLAQALIASPIVTGITLAAVQNVPAKFRLQLIALGASRPQMVWVTLREARLPMLAAVMAGFGGVISEVGASMMVGGNIKGSTRVLTTATVLETGKGNFDVAIALSVIPLFFIFNHFTWNPDNGRASWLINKFARFLRDECGIVSNDPTARYTLYSFRHTFMRAARVARPTIQYSEIIRLIGHKQNVTGRYGGADLKLLSSCINRLKLA